MIRTDLKCPKCAGYITQNTGMLCAAHALELERQQKVIATNTSKINPHRGSDFHQWVDETNEQMARDLEITLKQNELFKEALREAYEYVNSCEWRNGESPCSCPGCKLRAKIEALLKLGKQ